MTKDIFEFFFKKQKPNIEYNSLRKEILIILSKRDEANILKRIRKELTDRETNIGFKVIQTKCDKRYSGG